MTHLLFLQEFIKLFGFIYCNRNVYCNFTKILQKYLKMIRFRIHHETCGYIGDWLYIVTYLIGWIYLRREGFLQEGIIVIELPNKSNVEVSISSCVVHREVSIYVDSKFLKLDTGVMTNYKLVYSFFCKIINSYIHDHSIS